MKNPTKNYDWINYSFQKNYRKQRDKHFSRIIFFFVGIAHLMAVYAVLNN